MWRDVTCNQYGCERPAAFVGLTDIVGNGTLYLDSAAAWCYWCLPRTAMSPEAESMARHADWARRQTINDCKAVTKRVWGEVPHTDTIENVMDKIISELHRLHEGWEWKLANSMVPEEYWTGRKHTPEQVYAVRPAGNNDAAPEDATALQLRKPVK
jgi:hypothetical protein